MALPDLAMALPAASRFASSDRRGWKVSLAGALAVHALLAAAALAVAARCVVQRPVGAAAQLGGASTWVEDGNSDAAAGDPGQLPVVAPPMPLDTHVNMTAVAEAETDSATAFASAALPQAQDMAAEGPLFGLAAGDGIPNFQRKGSNPSSTASPAASASPAARASPAASASPTSGASPSPSASRVASASPASGERGAGGAGAHALVAPRLLAGEGNGGSLGIPKPDYPIECKRRREQGTVLLCLDVLPDGSVGNVKVVQDCGYPALAAAAVAAARRGRFVPGTCDGYPITFPVTIPFRFVLHG